MNYGSGAFVSSFGWRSKYFKKVPEHLFRRSPDVNVQSISKTLSPLSPRRERRTHDKHAGTGLLIVINTSYMRNMR